MFGTPVADVQGESPTGNELVESKGLGVGRSYAFTILTELEQAGIVTRPRRGVVSLAAAVRPFVAVPRKTRADCELQGAAWRHVARAVAAFRRGRSEGARWAP